MASAPNASLVPNVNGSLFVSSLPPAVFLEDPAVCRTQDLGNRALIEQYQWVFVLTLCLCAVNVCTNAFAFCVFRQDRHASVLTRFLLHLSMTEVLFQVVLICMRVLEQLIFSSHILFEQRAGAEAFSRCILFVLIPLLTALHIFRNWLVVLISSYRFEVVCRAPLGPQSTRVFRDDTVCRVTALAAVLALLVSAPRALEMAVRLCAVNDGVLVAAFEPRATKVRWFFYLYTSCALFLAQTAGPVVVVCVLSVLLLQRLAVRRRVRRDLRQASSCRSQATTERRASDGSQETQEEAAPTTHTFRHRLTSLPRSLGKPLRRRSSAGKSRRRDKDSGHLVLALCVVFFFCEMPSFFSKVDSQLQVLSQDARFNFGHLANFATLLDTFCNLFVYILSNAHFRQLLRVWYGVWERRLAALCCPRRREAATKRNGKRRTCGQMDGSARLRPDGEKQLSTVAE